VNESAEPAPVAALETPPLLLPPPDTSVPPDDSVDRPHPRTLGWVGVTSLAMGGSNQSLFLIGALLVAQGSAAVPLLGIGLLLSWAAAPGWLELVLMWPNRVGGIAATCAEAFRPYSPILANLTGVCYWWGWVPTCGLTALLSAAGLHQWYLPGVPIPLLAVVIVVAFTILNLSGVQRTTRVAIPIAAVSASLAFLSALIPIFSGHVDWHQAASFHLDSPFAGTFGGITSAMAGLYLIGFAAPAFEAATCHVGEMKDPVRNMRKAMLASALMAGVYFVILPVVWLGVFGPKELQNDLLSTLGPTFAPLVGGLGKSAAVWFLVSNMFHGTLQPLAGASRTLSQLSEDGLLPRLLKKRSRTDCPWVATVLTAGMAIVFLLLGDPIWMIAAANLTYLISIGLPSVAVWLLRRNYPQMPRPYRAPRGTIVLGLVAAGCWGISTILGFQQFGLPTVIFGVTLAYSGSLFYAWRRASDRRRAGIRTEWHSLHIKLTGAMLAVLILDAAGYLVAVSSLNRVNQEALVTVCEDIFVAVALLTITVGLVLPGMIGHATGQVARAANRLAHGTLAELTSAMEALGRGELHRAHTVKDVEPVIVHSNDELNAMASSFNTMQAEVARAALALEATREQLRDQRDHLERDNVALRTSERDLREHARELEQSNNELEQFAYVASHDLQEPLRMVASYVQLIEKRYEGRLDSDADEYIGFAVEGATRMQDLINDLLGYSRIGRGTEPARVIDTGSCVQAAVRNLLPAIRESKAQITYADLPPVHACASNITQLFQNLIANALKFHGEATPTIDIKAVRKDGAWLFSVDDNGIGIPADQGDRVFMVFQRLHSREQFAGTGIGLAICRKVVERNGGKIWVEPKRGGARFLFTMPFIADAEAVVVDADGNTVRPAKGSNGSGPAIVAAREPAAVAADGREGPHD